MKGNKGITLIALVVTIIVLLILAGVSIAMLTGDNSLLNNSKSAKVTQLEAEARERVDLAVGAAKIYAEQQSIEIATEYSAAKYVGGKDDTETTTQVVNDASGNPTSQTVKTIVAQLVTDLTEERNFEVTDVTAATTTDGTSTVKIKYESPEYKSATNNSGAKIDFTITIVGNSFTVSEIVYTPAH